MQTYTFATEIAPKAILSECQNRAYNVNIAPIVIAGSLLTGGAVLAL